jgi:phospholipid/cholesterol/gamma-HCH transport system substrate-binding protein
MSRSSNSAIKFGAFALVMVLLTAFLLIIFSQAETGPTASYSAVFADGSGLKAGDSVRVAGARIGTVNNMSLESTGHVVVDFDVDRKISLTTGTKAVVRYLNLVGDRFLELERGSGSTETLSAGSRIPLTQTAPALDLDLLLGGLKPVIEGLNPAQVNALTASFIQILQGQGGTLESLLSKTSSFANGLADHNVVIEQLVDNLRSTLRTVADDGSQFSTVIDRLEQLIKGLSADRDPIGEAISALDNGTASIADLLSSARPPLAGTINQLTRLAPLLDKERDRIDAGLRRAPENYRKLARLGAYGSFLNYYVCSVTFRASDLQGRTVVFPWVKQVTGRCAEPDA